MILALDLATKTGWCKGDGLSRPQSGVIRLPSTGDDIGAFLSAWWDQAPALFEGVTLAVFEAPLLPRTTSFKTVTKLHSLAGLTELLCLQRQIPVRSAHNGVVKKHFTGQGRAEKPAMIARAKMLGFSPKDDNEADAIAIWFFVATKKGGPLDHYALTDTWGRTHA
jgi:crossover junction endodeoxyribonuclease RuvC